MCRCPLVLADIHSCRSINSKLIAQPASTEPDDIHPTHFGLKCVMKIRLGGFPRRQMRVVRGLTCGVLLILAACVGGTTSAGIYTMPWDQQRGPNPETR